MVAVRGVALRVTLGVPDWERRRPQTLRLEFEFPGDIRRAAATDDVRHTADYAAVVFAVRRRLGGKVYRLIETVAEDAARVALETTRAREVRVIVRKKPPLPGVEGSEVMIIRRRPARLSSHSLGSSISAGGRRATHDFHTSRGTAAFPRASRSRRAVSATRRSRR